MIQLNYINKIKANISIQSNKKSANILDGTYKSIYRGKSMNFENLREYTINDDVKDIDWKSSARSGSLLVKQFIAEKKHNILLILDSGIKMKADTDKHESKKELALFAAGTIGYLAVKNNDYIGMIYKDENIEYKPFKYNIYNLEQYLCDYAATKNESPSNMEEVLDYVARNVPKKKIIFIFTDLAGINSMKTQTLKKLKQTSDISIVNIKDNFMMGEDIYDVADENYIPEIFLKDKKLNEIEMMIRNELLENNKKRLKSININLTTISSFDELNRKIIELLEEHKNE